MLASDLISIQIAESLYQQGILSYPRTETDQFDPQFDLQSLIEKQTANEEWGGFATRYGGSQSAAVVPISAPLFARMC